MNRKALFTVKVFVKLSTRRFFRDRVALFFTIIFPLIFLFVFGSINSGDNSDISFKVAVVNQSDSSFAKGYSDNLSKEKVFKVDPNIHSLDGAQEKMKRGELDATIVLPAHFGDTGDKGYPSGNLKVFYTQNNQSAGITLSTVLEGQLKDINKNIVKADTPFTVSREQTNERSLSAFDYTFAGLLGFAIIGLGIFGPVNVFPELKKQGILRRLHTTPLKVWQYFLANAISQAAVGLVTLSILFLVAIAVFKLHVVGNVFELAIFIALSIMSILGIGLAIGGWASNERQAAPLSNIIVFPMLFLSGTFFPRFLMPDWLQHISTFLPLTPVIDGIRLIATEGKHLVDIGPQLGLIAVWTLVVYAIAFRVFRWE
jgi:ABC-2 type transport system permease protein